MLPSAMFVLLHKAGALRSSEGEEEEKSEEDKSPSRWKEMCEYFAMCRTFLANEKFLSLAGSHSSPTRPLGSIAVAACSGSVLSYYVYANEISKNGISEPEAAALKEMIQESLGTIHSHRNSTHDMDFAVHPHLKSAYAFASNTLKMFASKKGDESEGGN